MKMGCRGGWDVKGHRVTLKVQITKCCNTYWRANLLDLIGLVQQIYVEQFFVSGLILSVIKK